MINLIFLTAQGDRTETAVDPGTTLLDAGQNAGLPLEGTCEGQMACSTCHVILPRDWFDRLPSPSADEEDMLDLAAGVTATSRLACQIRLTAEMDGLIARVPAHCNNMQLW